MSLVLFGTVHAAPISVVSTTNGFTELYSNSFDGNMVAPADPFFGGTPPATRNVQIIPAPTGTSKAIPIGIPGVASGSFLDLTLGNSNSELTLAGGVVTFSPTTIIVNEGQVSETTVVTNEFGFVLLTSVGTPSIPMTVLDGDDGSVDGSFTFEVGEDFRALGPPVNADFSAFTDPDLIQSCVGGLCGALTGGALNLDMLRYRLIVSYDGTFTNFAGDFQGQTGNTSIVFATLDGNMGVLVPVPAAVWLFGSGLGLLAWFRRRRLA